MKNSWGCFLEKKGLSAGYKYTRVRNVSGFAVYM